MLSTATSAIKYIYLFTLLLTLLLPTKALTQAQCDTDKACYGRALTLTVNSGRGAHYVDVDKSPALTALSSAMTFECWVKAEEQTGKRQFIAGLWGPRQDDNDVWVVYISENNELVFEINGDGTKLGQMDNTIARAPAAGIYNRWTHIAAVFDGSTQQASLYVDGRIVAVARNAAYPANYLRPLERSDLLMQIGSCNALTDNADLFRTLKGQIDDIRIWNIAVPGTSIDCRSRQSLNGNEAGLVLFYRCNDATSSIDLCNATGNNAVGRMRNGAACRDQAPRRDFPQTVVLTKLQWPTTMNCDSSAQFIFQIMDTSACGSQARIGFSGNDRNLYRVISPTGLINLPQNVPVQCTVEVRANSVGTFRANIDINPNDRCGKQIREVANVTRVTELSYSTNSFVFDTLYVGCRDTRFREDTLRICNNSQNIGQPRTVTVQGYQIKNPTVFEVIPSTGFSLAPGECRTVRVRVNLRDTAAAYNDTLVILSDDRCPGKAIIRLQGTVADVLTISQTDGKTRLDSMRFDTTCVGLISNPKEYMWKNVSGRPIIIDSIRMPQGYIGTRIQLPRTLQHNQAYLANVIRFRPHRQGAITDSVIFYTSIEGCLIEKKIYVTGRGYAPELILSDTVLDLGDVLVGQTSRRSLGATNTGIDTIRASFFLKIGEQFSFPGGRGFLLNGGQSNAVQIEFRPPSAGVFEDTICIFEQRCFTTICIPVRGRGIEQVFDFQPDILTIPNVLSCGNAQDTLQIVNVSGSNQVLSAIALSDPAGKFTVVEPSPLPNSVPLANGSSWRVIVRYSPNDLTTDRADRAYLRYQTADNRRWEAELFGSSALTRIGVSDNTQFGIVEVGSSRTEDIRIENLSATDVSISAIRLPAGYTFATAPTLPQTLTPRQVLTVQVVFTPTVKTRYRGNVEVDTDAPCVVSGNGSLDGQGEIYQLDAPLQLITWGFTRPCDCIVRDLPLVNRSENFPMVVDSLWIDKENIPDSLAGEKLYSWSSALSPTGTLPIIIPPNSSDTVKILFCPKAPSVRAWIPNAARLHIKANGSGWQAEYDVFLSGQRALMFEADARSRIFAPAPVDTLAPPRFFTLKIPEVAVNPFQEDIVIDSISFLPDERVFTAMAADSTPFPLTLKAGDSLRIRVDCRPRAPRVYKALMVLHQSKPCADIDTTLQVEGSGFAPAFGLQFTFDNTRTAIDTFAITTCDTLVVPVYTNREIPANVVDISFRLRYDTTALAFLDAISPYTTPSVTNSTTVAGADVVLKNCRNVDSLQPMLLARFVPTTAATTTFPFLVDSISFDTEEVIFYNIVAGNDNAIIAIRKAEITVLNAVQFDSVRILDCSVATLTIQNTGDVDVRLQDMLEQIPHVTYVGNIPPDTLLAPGAVLDVPLRFCPLESFSFDTLARVLAVVPCRLTDSVAISGIGFAPPFPVRFAAVAPFSVVDTIAARIGDTVTFTIAADRDFAADYERRYWLEKLSFSINVLYNHFALKFLDADYVHSSGSMALGTTTPGDIQLQIEQADSIVAGDFIRLRFAVTVPDREVSGMNVNAEGFRSDAIMFLDIQPAPESDAFRATERCRLTTLQYSGVSQPELSAPVPNPATENVALTFRIQETVPVVLRVYSAEGKLCKVLLDGSTTLSGGEYKVEFSCHDMPAGVYYYTLEGGVFSATRKLLIIK